MAGITGYGNDSWMLGQQADAFQDKTLSQKKWDAYISGMDSIEEELRRQVELEGEMNLQVADQERSRQRETWSEEWERFVAYSKVNMERIMKADERDNVLFAKEETEGSLLQAVSGSSSLKVEAEPAQEKDHGLWFPYENMSQDGLTITYNGVTFMCNKEDHTISLGDMSNPKDVLSIPLSGGGTLQVNKHNIGDLGRAIGMFSPEDIGIILRAVAEFQKITSVEYEMEEDELDNMEKMTEGSSKAVEGADSEKDNPSDTGLDSVLDVKSEKDSDEDK